MAQYFVRFSDSKQWLENDAERGYSFHSYHFSPSPESLLEEYYPDRLEEIDDATDTMEEYQEQVQVLADIHSIRQHNDGQYGFALKGLCGYGPFETLEEAEEESKNGSYGIYTICGIYEGYEAGIDPDNNQLFHPFKLIKVITA